MPVGIGQAIALGNLAQVDRSKPFTNAVLNRQKLDLADQERRAKQRQQEQEQQKQLKSMLKFGKGGFTPFFQEQAAKIASEGVQKQIQYLNEGNQISMMNEGAKMEAQLEDLKQQQDATTKFLELKKQGFLIPKELEQGFSGIRSQNEKGIQDFLTKNPQYQEIVKYDPASGSYSFNPVKDIDLNKAYDASIRENESQMTQSKFIKGVDNNTSLYELSLSPDQVTSIAASYGTNPEYVRNLKLKEPAKFQKEIAAIQTSMPELSADQIETIAASKIAEESLQTRNKKVHFETKAQPNNFNINLGSGLNYNNNGASPAGGNTTTIKRPLTLNGQTKLIDVPVVTGNTYGFKPVSVLSLKSDGFINANGNEKITGQTLQETKTGSALPMPIATKRFKNSKSGDIIEVGEIVDEKQLQSMIDQGAVKWVPMFPVNSKGKNKNDEEVTISAFVPVENIAQQVIVSQSKDDAPVTQKSIQNAIDEAADRNSKLPKVKGQTTTKTVKHPLPTGKPRRGKKNGVWYTWSEETGKYEPE
jgi:hypothetical protein